MSELPPLDLAQAYVVVGPNDQRGPYALELLLSEVLAQRLSEATPVWWPGLADWTTMGGHPGVAAELQRRRAAAQPGGWTTPTGSDPYAAPEPAPAQQPAASPYDAASQPQASPYQADPYQADPYQVDAAAQHAGGAQTTDPSAADPYGAQPAAAPAAEPVGEQRVAPDPFAPPADDVGATVIGVVEELGSDDTDEDGPDDVVDAEVIEVDVAVVSSLDPGHIEIFSALVARSSERAVRQSRIDAVDAAVVDAVVDGVVSQGFELAERNDTDRAHELRFDGPDSDLVVVALGRPGRTDPDGLREDHLPLTISYRSSTTVSTTSEGEGEHGEVVVSADEWTGQATSNVELFLGLEDYLDDDLAVDSDSLSRDITAAVAVLRSKLS